MWNASRIFSLWFSIYDSNISCGMLVGYSHYSSLYMTVIFQIAQVFSHPFDVACKHSAFSMKYLIGEY